MPALYKIIDKSITDNTGRYVEKSTNQIIISSKVERIIRYYCSMSPNNEWSGILFYKVEGDFDSPEFKIICEDIYLMDIGSAGYTSYDFKSADISTYLMDHPELLDCYQGLIHSHDTMEAFFSGVDTKTLQSEGNDTIIFVSLIVNNAGKYVASVTRKVDYNSTVTEVGKYSFFGDVQKTTAVESYVTQRQELQYFPLKVIKEEVYEHPMAKRFLEIQDAKRKVRSVSPYSNTNYDLSGYISQNYPKSNLAVVKSSQEKFEDNYWHNSSAKITPIEQKLPFESKEGDIEDIEDIPYGLVTFDTNKLNKNITQLLTGSCFVNYKKIDLEDWCKKIDDIYSKRFKDSIYNDNIEEKVLPSEDRINRFIENWCDLIVNDVEDETLTRQGYNTDNVIAIFAYDAVHKITELQGKLTINSSVLDKFIDELNMYLI